jgi:hypothetical protein
MNFQKVHGITNNVKFMNNHKRNIMREGYFVTHNRKYNLRENKRVTICDNSEAIADSCHCTTVSLQVDS